MLTNARIVQAHPKDARYKLFDEKGLYLLVTPTGSRLWGFKYRHGGTERSLRFGAYPDVSLKGARSRRDAARDLLRAGTDPSEARKATKVAEATTFRLVGKEYLGQTTLKPNTLQKQHWLLKLLRPLHNRPVSHVQAPELLEALRAIERLDGRHETAHRANMLAGRILRYAIATGRRDGRDVAPDLKGLLKPVETTSHAAITDPKELGALLRAIDVYDGHTVVRHALQIAPLVFVRPGELRGMRWAEIDWAKAEWLIPAERMKMQRPHLVPLARQTIFWLRQLETETGDMKHVFPSPRGDRPMSENAITAALRYMFYDGDEHTGHGFRSTASTLLNGELKVDPVLVELQLAHAKQDKIAGIYDRSQRVAERRIMMQDWADYLDKLRGEAE